MSKYGEILMGGLGKPALRWPKVVDVSNCHGENTLVGDT
jgi:hypothetical protein